LSTWWGLDAFFSFLLFSSLLFSSLLLSTAAGCLPAGGDEPTGGGATLTQALAEDAPDPGSDKSEAECVSRDPPPVLEVAAWSVEAGSHRVALQVEQLEPLEGFFEIAVDVAGPEVRHQSRVRVDPSTAGGLALDLRPYLPDRGPAQITLTARLMVEEFTSYEAPAVVLAYVPGAEAGAGQLIDIDLFQPASERPEDRVDVRVTLGALPFDDDGDGDHDHADIWGGVQ
jgi:hypothetical protein